MTAATATTSAIMASSSSAATRLPVFRVLCVANGPRTARMRALHGNFADLIRHTILRARAHSASLGGGAHYTSQYALPSASSIVLAKQKDEAAAAEAAAALVAQGMTTHGDISSGDEGSCRSASSAPSGGVAMATDEPVDGVCASRIVTADPIVADPQTTPLHPHSHHHSHHSAESKVPASSASNVDDAILRALDAVHLEFIEVRPFEGTPLPENIDDIGAVIFSGSKYMVSDRAPWVEDVSAWIRRHAAPSDGDHLALATPATFPKTAVPMFGLCFGHQLVGHALGGVSDYNPRGIEAGTFSISIPTECASLAASDPVISPLYRYVAAAQEPAEKILYNDNDKAATNETSSLSASTLASYWSNHKRFPRHTFVAHEAHAQSVLKLPAGAISLACTEKDENQLVRYAPAVYGTQFHPEYSLSYMRDLAPTLDWLKDEKGALSEEAYLGMLEHTFEASGLLASFLVHAMTLRPPRARE